MECPHDLHRLGQETRGGALGLFWFLFCSPGWPSTHYTDQPGLKLTGNQPLVSAGIEGVCHYTKLYFFFLFFLFFFLEDFTF